MVRNEIALRDPAEPTSVRWEPAYIIGLHSVEWPSFLGVLCVIRALRYAATRRAYVFRIGGRLEDYFVTLCQNAYADPTDMRLVVHALLDSDQNARKWPLRPYLDELIRITSATSWGRTKKVSAQLSWVSQMIGMIQYHIISALILSGMYDADTATILQVEMVKRLEHAVHEFCAH